MASFSSEQSTKHEETGGGGSESPHLGADQLLLNGGLKKAKKDRGCTAKERISKMPPCTAGKRSFSHRRTGRYEAHLWDKSTWNQNQNKKGQQGIIWKSEAATMRKSRPHREPAKANHPSSSESRYSHDLLRVTVAQICQSMGFRGAQHSALEVITDIAARYLKTIAKAGATSANACCRIQSNLCDIILALEDLASVQGFPGASYVGPHSLYVPAAIKDLMNFVKYTDEIPFAQPLPPRKIFSEQGKLSGPSDVSWHCDGNNMRHLPSWLPALPSVAVPEEKERKWEEGRWGCLNGGEGREEVDRRQKMVKREENKEIELLGHGKRMKVGFILGIGNGSVV